MKRLAFLALAALIAFAAPAHAETIDVQKAMQDHALGKEDAPVTIIEYASLTCPHCAHFNTNVLPEIQKQLIDTGKAKLYFRDFPLDGYALKASMMARCAPADKYHALISVIFSNQERWTKAEKVETGLSQLGVLAGMDPAYIESCLANEDLKKAIVTAMDTARKEFDIKQTPTFIFMKDGKRMDTWDEFDTVSKSAPPPKPHDHDHDHD